MLEVAEAAGDAAAEFDDPVDGLGTTVARAVGVEVGQERGLPASQGLSEPGDLGNRAGRQRGDEFFGKLASSCRRGLVEHVPKVLSAAIGDFDRDVIGMGRERSFQASLLARREAFSPGAENMADAVEGVALAASVAEAA